MEKKALFYGFFLLFGLMIPKVYCCNVCGFVLNLRRLKILLNRVGSGPYVVSSCIYLVMQDLSRSRNWNDSSKRSSDPLSTMNGS